MLVRVKGYGSIWASRNRDNPKRGQGPAVLSAFYNTTGVPTVHNNLRRFWRIAGQLRVNGYGAGFNPHFPLRTINEVFRCSDLEQVGEVNQFLLVKRVDPQEPVDNYLIVITNQEVGWIEEHCFSPEVQVVAFSQRRDRQEIMLLMPPLSSFVTIKGTYIAVPSDCPSNDGAFKVTVA